MAAAHGGMNDHGAQKDNAARVGCTRMVDLATLEEVQVWKRRKLDQTIRIILYILCLLNAPETNKTPVDRNTVKIQIFSNNNSPFKRFTNLLLYKDTK
jgi:hypothetical protein